MPKKACERYFFHVKAFQKKSTRDQFQNRKSTENNVLRFWGISKNYANAITWRNNLSHAVWFIPWYSPYFPSLTVPSFFGLLKDKKGVFRNFLPEVWPKVSRKIRYDQSAEVIWVKDKSSFYQFLPCISGSLKNVGLSFTRRKRTHLLRRYSHYSVASTNQAAFFIGGWNGVPDGGWTGISLSIIAKYENDNWSLHGNLKRRRINHGSITYGTATLVIGGQTFDGS